MAAIADRRSGRPEREGDPERSSGDSVGFVDRGLDLLDAIEGEIRPLRSAYDALQQQQARLVEPAAELGASLFPSPGSKWRRWRGQDYLQIGRFWVGVDPVSWCVLAQANPPEAEPVERLARSIGRSVELRNGNPSLIVLDEGELRAGSPLEAIAGAFDTWLTWKREPSDKASP